MDNEFDNEQINNETENAVTSEDTAEVQTEETAEQYNETFNEAVNEEEHENTGVVSTDEKATAYAEENTTYAAPVYHTEEPKKKRKSGSAVAIGILSAVVVICLVTTSFVLGTQFVKNTVDNTFSSEKINPISNPETVKNETPKNTATNPDYSIPAYSTPDYSLTAKSSEDIMDVPSLVAELNPSVVDIVVTTANGQGIGSGFIISEDGYIVTCAHVVDEATTVYVILYGETEKIQATVVGFDSYSDVGVIKIDRTGLTPVEIGDSEKLVQGEQVVAIGTPLDLELTHTVTVGYVSGIRDNFNLSSLNMTLDLIQHTATINPGNSGGPLVNMYGQVVGINSVKILSSEYSGTTCEDIAFAVQMDTALPIIEELINNGSVSRPQIGIKGMTDSTIGGVYVGEIIPGGGASAADVQIGDIITKCDGIRVKTIEDFISLLGKYKVGDTVEITILRDVDVVVTKIVLQAPSTAE